MQQDQRFRRFSDETVKQKAVRKQTPVRVVLRYHTGVDPELGFGGGGGI